MKRESGRKWGLVNLVFVLAIAVTLGCQQEKVAPLAPAGHEPTSLPAGFGLAPKSATPPNKNVKKKPGKKTKKSKPAPKKPASNG